MRYSKRPVTIEAEWWDGSEESIAAICRWANESQPEPVVHYLTAPYVTGPFDVMVETLNGPVRLQSGEYVVKGVQGEFYPCKADIFEKTHREASDDATLAETWTEPSGQGPPPRATLTKEFKFEAAHQLPNHDGKCARPHGHSYRVLVQIEGEVKPADGSPDEGMVMDFSKVKEAWKQVEPLLDHRDLNETIGPDVGPTTAENIAGWILRSLGYWLYGVTAVTVYETASSSVTVRNEAS